MTKDQRQNAAQAALDLEDIDRLRNFPPFTRYFMRRLNQMIKAKEITILTAENIDEKAEKKILKAWQEVAGMLDRDEAGNRNIIESASLG